MGDKAGGDWHAVPNFVEIERYSFVPTVPDDAPLVFLGRLDRIKGAHTAIKIAQAAKRKLIIAGNRVNTEEGERYWQSEILPHLGRSGVSYVGPVNDAAKATLLGSAAAMVSPVEWGEPFGIVFIEALACGTPVISTPKGALPEIVEEGKNGFLVASVEEGRRAVELLSRISRAECRVGVASRFSSEIVVSQYESIYSQALR